MTLLLVPLGCVWLFVIVNDIDNDLTAKPSVKVIMALAMTLLLAVSACYWLVLAVCGSL